MDNMNSLFAALALRKLLESKYGYNDDGTPKQAPDEKEEDFTP